jgi:predicted DsbA family dithiol-disulfide isomerase
MALPPPASTARPLLTIDLWADLTCPWCWIGERRLQRALERRPGLRVGVRWRPFLLQPDLPPEGMPWASFAAAKFGDEARVRAVTAQVAAVGAAEGIPFAFQRMTRAPHTLDAHRLVLAAQEVGKAAPMAEALFHAHFHGGRDLNDLEVLRSLGAGVGIPSTTLDPLLASDDGADEVWCSADRARRMGIRGVPFFVFGERYGVSGAQTPELLLEALDATLTEAAMES